MAFHEIIDHVSIFRVDDGSKQQTIELKKIGHDKLIWDRLEETEMILKKFFNMTWISRSGIFLWYKAGVVVVYVFVVAAADVVVVAVVYGKAAVRNFCGLIWPCLSHFLPATSN